MCCYLLINPLLKSNGGGPDWFGYVFTDTDSILEPDAPSRPSDEAKQLAQLDPNSTECVQNANTQSYFRCLTIAGNPEACRIGAGIGLVRVCPTSDTFDAFDESTESCLRIELIPSATNPFFSPSGAFFGTLGFGFTFYGEVAEYINICPSGFITINAPETFTGINVRQSVSGEFLGTELIEKKFPNIDNNTTEKFEGFPATIAAYYTFLNSTPDASVGGSGVYVLYISPAYFPIGPNTGNEVFIIEYNNVVDNEGNRSTFQIVLYGRVFDISDPNNPVVIDELDLIVIKYERAASDSITFRLAGINSGDGNGLTWKSGTFDVVDTAVSYLISLSPAPSKLFSNDSIKGAQTGFEGNPVTITTFFPVFSAIFEGRRCERAFAAKIQFSTDPNFDNIVCTSGVINFPVTIPPAIRSPNLTATPCHGQVAFKPFVQYYWRIVFWKREYPPDTNGDCSGPPGEPERTLYTSTRIGGAAKPNSFIICPTCQKSGTGSSLGLPGGEEGGARAVIGTYTGQGTGGSSGGSCAIATASLNNENKLTYFRFVRNKYIFPTNMGKKFISFYYRYSENIANLIKENKPIKLLFQITLNAIYSYIFFVHHLNITFKIFLLILFLLLLYLIRKFTLA